MGELLWVKEFIFLTPKSIGMKKKPYNKDKSKGFFCFCFFKGDIQFFVDSRCFCAQYFVAFGESNNTVKSQFLRLFRSGKKKEV